MDEILYTTPEEQINKLKGQNLNIEDEDTARSALSVFGYSNLIKSYREPYTVIVNGKKVYRSDITFNQIVSLYMLDKQLRNAVMASMIDLEEHIKEAAADVISNNFGTHPHDYLKFRNYANKRKTKHRFTLNGILETMTNTLSTEKDPIHHYQEVHGIVPPWILFKSIYFSTITNFIDQFKTVQKNQLVNKLYDITELGITEESGRLLMMDTLYICLEYRNLAAHGGRTYNYQTQYSLRKDEIFNSGPGIQLTGFSQLLFLLSLFNYQAPYNHLSHVLSQEVNRHCHRFPQDATYLAQILNLNIEYQHIVWISPTSKKYHSNPHCSGLANVTKVTLEEAEGQGYIPCKRCNKL